MTLSASDVVDFLACAHLTALDLRRLRLPDDSPAPLPPDEQAQLLAAKGLDWERRWLERLRAAHPDLVEIAVGAGVPRQARQEAAVAATLAAMASGAPVIYQASLAAPGFFGRADFLRRVPGRSRFGDWSYEAIDTKYAQSARAEHVLQLSFYSWLLESAQGSPPRRMHLVTGDGVETGYRVADFAHYFERLRRRAAKAVAELRTDTYADPCERCSSCHWRARCDQQRLDDDHLWQVAGISRHQVRKLQEAGIPTLAALARCAADRHVPRLAPDTFQRLRRQAVLQRRGRELGGPCHELLPPEAGRGFERLPLPCAGDVYFDMEGDPLHEGGLEYLFGVTWREDGALQFRAFWAHDRDEEKRAFEAFIDWLGERRRRWPDFHVYHYAAYENSALKTLMSRHATREDEVDALLREHRLVDLYRVVIESLVASTPSYSIKKIEAFYRGGRSGEVADGGASVVAYERWRASGDPALLESIERYNRDDCDSTAQLHAWLLGLRPAELPWRGSAIALPGDGASATAAGAEATDPKAQARAEKKAEAERRRGAAREALAADLPADRASWSDAQHARHLAACLLDFHQREAKPTWWKIFAAADLTPAELIDDVDCIGGLRRLEVLPPAGGRRKLPTWVLEFPEQDFKARTGSILNRIDTQAGVKILEVDEGRRQLRVQPSGKALEPDTGSLALGPSNPVDTGALRDAVARFAEAWAAAQPRHLALRAILEKSLPRLRGRPPGAPLVATRPAPIAAISAAVRDLDDSYLFIQGPPGAGKTFAGSRVIVDLLQAGKRVGISSNSHKAIANLLAGVVEVARERGVALRGARKGNDDGDPDPFAGSGIVTTEDNGTLLDATQRLVAGTAWQFALPAAEGAFDFLFIDEAGQVSLGHLVAIGVAARNIVLLGDQMQLPQPTQGIHPERSGDSVLDYLLDGRATIEPERGIFLSDTWRMHPDVCAFISAAIYDGELESAAPCGRQALLLSDPPPHPALRATGIRFWPVHHDECTQRSEPEADAVRAIYASLVGLPWRDRNGRVAPLATDDLLVVAPWNLQVNLLRQVLPAGARVGTVDKFQGQEAVVVIVSLATSSGDYLPRDIEFLYSRNRLNVALSRARCLAILVASPRLMDVPCRTPQQIALVNTLCWVDEYSAALARPRAG